MRKGGVPNLPLEVILNISLDTLIDEYGEKRAEGGQCPPTVTGVHWLFEGLPHNFVTNQTHLKIVWSCTRPSDYQNDTIPSIGNLYANRIKGWRYIPEVMMLLWKMGTDPESWNSECPVKEVGKMEVICWMRTWWWTDSTSLGFT